MTNRYWNDSPDIVDGTKSNAGSINDKFNGVEAGFDAVQGELDRSPRLPASFSGTVQIPDVTLTNRLIYVNASGNLDLYPLSNISDAVDAAAASETAAGQSEANAATSETNAGNSASAAAGSATNASNEAAAASSSATAAATSASNASTSESNAAGSASAAATSESNASGHATAASNSATAASNSASAADSSATAASNSASSASSSASSASSSATAASATFDDLDTRYLGSKSTAPTTDNNGDPLTEGTMYFNTTTGRTYIWYAGSWNIAAEPSSGPVDAATLGGYSAAELAVRAENETISGSWTFTADQSFTAGVDFGSATAANNTNVTRHLALYGTSYGLNVTSNTLNLVAGGGSGTVDMRCNEARVSGSKVWTAANDGSGSGLNADLLDGQHASSFAPSSHSHSYLPLSGGTVSGSLTVSNTLSVRGAIDLADNDILRLGSSDDCEFFCNGSHMYMDLNAGIGNFYIRDGSTTRFTFDDAGHFTATGNVTAYSDRRLKENVAEIVDPLAKVQSLRGVTFDWSESGDRGIGVIAQELEAIFPELVMEQEDGYKSVAYGNLTAVLIEAVKALSTRIDRLEGGRG